MHFPKGGAESGLGSQSRDLPNQKTAKVGELQTIIWFLEAGWKLFTPVRRLARWCCPTSCQARAAARIQTVAGKPLRRLESASSFLSL